MIIIIRKMIVENTKLYWFWPWGLWIVHIDSIHAAVFHVKPFTSVSTRNKNLFIPINFGSGRKFYRWIFHKLSKLNQPVSVFCRKSISTNHKLQDVWSLYLQIVFSQVLVPPAIFILIEDWWDFRPLWLRIWLICLQAAIKGAGGRGLKSRYLRLEQRLQPPERKHHIKSGRGTMRNGKNHWCLFQSKKVCTCPLSTDAPLLPSSREALQWKHKWHNTSESIVLYPDNILTSICRNLFWVSL